jgi:hypothetical protein
MQYQQPICKGGREISLEVGGSLEGASAANLHRAISSIRCLADSLSSRSGTCPKSSALLHSRHTATTVSEFTGQPLASKNRSRRTRLSLGCEDSTLQDRAVRALVVNLQLWPRFGPTKRNNRTALRRMVKYEYEAARVPPSAENVLPSAPQRFPASLQP